jgi:hypothetical protein
MAMAALAVATNVQPSNVLYSAEAERACLGAALLGNSFQMRGVTYTSRLLKEQQP